MPVGCQSTAGHNTIRRRNARAVGPSGAAPQAPLPPQLLPPAPARLALGHRLVHRQRRLDHLVLADLGLAAVGGDLSGEQPLQLLRRRWSEAEVILLTTRQQKGGQRQREATYTCIQSSAISTTCVPDEHQHQHHACGISQQTSHRHGGLNDVLVRPPNPLLRGRKHQLKHGPGEDRGRWGRGKGDEREDRGR